MKLVLKASFRGLFWTNFTDHFCKLFLFTKFMFANLWRKVSFNILRSTCLEFCASNYFSSWQVKFPGISPKSPPKEAFSIPKNISGGAMLDWLALFLFLFLLWWWWFRFSLLIWSFPFLIWWHQMAFIIYSTAFQIHT